MRPTDFSMGLKYRLICLQLIPGYLTTVLQKYFWIFLSLINWSDEKLLSFSYKFNLDTKSSNEDYLENCDYFDYFFKYVLQRGFWDDLLLTLEYLTLSQREFIKELKTLSNIRLTARSNSKQTFFSRSLNVILGLQDF